MVERIVEGAGQKDEFQQIMELINEGHNFLLSGGAGSGKTYSLVQVIRKVIAHYPTSKVACMTYTNAAVKQIEERVNHESLKVSTIHDFLWDNIKNYQVQLKEVLIELINDDSVSKIKLINGEKVSSNFYDSVDEINYSYQKTQLVEGIISHDELLIISNKMFEKYALLSDIIKDKFKFIFIDEYQDSHKEVIEIFLRHITVSKKKNIIGFFGDAMQSIYEKGIGDLKEYSDIGIVKEVKKAQNRRNPDLVMKLANKLRTDGIVQKPSEDLGAPNMQDNGIVKLGQILFLHSIDSDIQKVKDYLRDKHQWDFLNVKETKELNLTHNLIAGKAGFRSLMDIYDKDPIIALKSDVLKRIKDDREYNKPEIEILSDDTFDEIVDKFALNSTPYILDEIKLDDEESKIYESVKNISINDFVNQDFQTPLMTELLKKVINQKKIPKKNYHQYTNFGSFAEDLNFTIKILKKDIILKDADTLNLYNKLKNKLFSEVRRIYLDKDFLIDDKKQDEGDESKKGSKRDRLIKHLFKIQNNIFLYENKFFNEFLKHTDYKIKKISHKKVLKQIIQELINVENKTIEEIINIANEKKICLIDHNLNKFITENEYVYDRVKNIEYREFQNLYNYLEGKTPFSTQHKVKGDEFDNVLVVLDNGNWNDYNFEYLFDAENQERILVDGKSKTKSKLDSFYKTLPRTQKIFYVCCTRSKENLAVFYHNPSQAILDKANEWFDGRIINLDII